MLDQSFELRGRLCGRESPTHELHFVLNLGTYFELRVEPVRQTECIPFIGLDHPFGTFLHMNAVDSNIQLEQILLKQPVVMASMFQQYRNLFNGHQLAKMIHEGPKSFSGLFKSKGRTALKALVSLEQGAPEQASHMP